MYRPELTAIRREEALRYLGITSAAPDPGTEALLDWGEKRLLEAAAPRVVYRLLPLEEGRLAGCAFQPEGADIAALLAECAQVVLLAATLGAGVDSLLLRTEAEDMARAVVLDALASTAVEMVCDGLEDWLRRELAPRGLYLTDRFSPGYGDMPIGQQGGLCAALDAQRRIGLTVSSAGLLIPRKSVTAVMGVSDRPQPRRISGCGRCDLAGRCPYRKEGKTCGK